MSAFLSGQQKLCCAYCQGEHFPCDSKCDKVTDVNARKEIRKKSLYLCLKTGHVSKKLQKIIFIEFLARNTTLVFVRKGIDNRLIKVQIQWLI